MPSLQHEFLKLSLQTASFSFQLNNFNIHNLRNILELSMMWTFLPWRVHFKSIKIKKRLGAEWILPDGADDKRVMLYLHGGGYAVGSANTHRAFVGQIAKDANIKALIIDYRKAPESPFPAAVDDAIIAYEWLLEQGYESQNIVFAGDSAGGGLVISTFIALRENHIAMPAAGICLSPWTDLTVSGESIEKNAGHDRLILALEMRDFAKKYAGKYPLNHPMLSPIFADLKGLPSLLIQVSDGEMLYNDSTRVAEVAQKAGVKVDLQVWQGLIHWWHLFWQFVPEGAEALQKIKEYIHKTIPRQ